MIHEIKYFKLPQLLIEEQKNNPATKDLYLTEIGEILVDQGDIWDYGHNLENHMLIYCMKGSGIIQAGTEQIPVLGEQFYVVPAGNPFKIYSLIDFSSLFYVACFGGAKTQNMADEFSRVRNLIPSVNNMVANREMLFDEVFNNLSRGFHDENLEYINYCFGHLLATFIYAHKNSDGFPDETTPVVRQAIDFMNKNLDKKLTLMQISKKVGYSPTYFTTLFSRETGYAPLSYFSHLKILRACESLDFTNLKIKEISFGLGYSDPYYFSKDFTKKMGLSPRQYRYRAVSRKIIENKSGEAQAIGKP
jgi:AraC family transcriptional regulator, arabinose operon regulatory protein